VSLILLVPPGIGDFSAMYQKLCCIDRDIIIRPSADAPERIGPYLDILPKVKNGGYSGHNAMASVTNTLPPGTDVANLQDGTYLLAINTFLEYGGKVADWIPGPTEYHYTMHRPLNHIGPVYDFLISSGATHPLIGVYCSAYGNSRHWGFWGPVEWKEFLSEVRKMVPPEATFIFIGAEYDIQISDVLYDWMQKEGIRSFYTVGSFHIAGTIELIKNLDYFFSFPSGLGFLADVIRTPNFMWFPPHLDPMRGTFADPEQYESEQTLHVLFTGPKVAAKWFEIKGRKHMEERCAQNTDGSVR